MANFELELRRRVLPEVNYLFQNYPAGVISEIVGLTPPKALKMTTRILARVLEVAKDYMKEGRLLEEGRQETIKPFIADAEKASETFVEKVSLRPSDDSWKKENERVRDAILLVNEEEKERALWHDGYYHKAFAHQHTAGMEMVPIPLTKDLLETFTKCYEKYADSKFIPDDEPVDAEKKKEEKVKPKSKFVIKMRSGPFGGTSEVPLALSRVAELEIERAIGAYGDDELADLDLRLKQIWEEDEQNDTRHMEKMEKKYGPSMAQGADGSTVMSQKAV